MSEVPSRWTRLWCFVKRCLGLGSPQDSVPGTVRRQGAGAASRAERPALPPDQGNKPQPSGEHPGASGSAPRGTLMLDAFMPGADTPADLEPPTSDSSPDDDRGDGEKPRRAAYYGTLAVPEQSYPTDNDDSQDIVPPRGSPPTPHLASPPPVKPAQSPPRQQPEAPPSEMTPAEAVSSDVPASDTDDLVRSWEERRPTPSGPPSELEVASPAPSAESPATPSPGVPEEIGSLHIGQPTSHGGQLPPPARPLPSSMLEEDQPALIPLAEREEQLARLEYVCQKLREARLPWCALNGMLTLLPLRTIQAGTRENVELQRAMKADLATLQRELKLRFPSTVLVVGLEEDRGFEELVRRVGPRRATSQRFGHRFDVRATATPGQLVSLCARVTGVFEDWVYTIYRERGSTARPGNSHLFGLLCTVRTQLQSRLLRLLTGGFGHDQNMATSDEPIAFSGCYFAATGRTEDRRAFVPAVFEKLIEEQNQVEWTSRARTDGRWFLVAGWGGFLVAAGLGAWLLVDVLSTLT